MTGCCDDLDPGTSLLLLLGARTIRFLRTYFLYFFPSFWFLIHKTFSLLMMFGREATKYRSTCTSKSDNTTHTLFSTFRVKWISPSSVWSSHSLRPLLHKCSHSNAFKWYPLILQKLLYKWRDRIAQGYNFCKNCHKMRENDKNFDANISLTPAACF